MSLKLHPLSSLVLYNDITKEESVKDLIVIRLNEHEQNTPMMYEQDYGSTLQRTREAHLYALTLHTCIYFRFISV